MKHLLVIFLGLIFITESYAQGYNVDVKISGEKNKNLILAIHCAPDKYNNIDTAKLDKKGRAVFSGTKPLTPGMYLVLLNNTRVLDFFISDNNNQSFSIIVNKNNFPEALSFKNSPENEAFVDYSRFMYDTQKKEAELIDKAKQAQNKNTRDNINTQMELLAASTSEKIKEIKTKYPETLFSSVVSALHPKKTTDINKNNYWDNIPLTDKRIQNTPILISAIDGYFNYLVPQVPDSINNAIDILLTKTEADTAMMRFITRYIFEMYVQTEFIGIENVLVHIVDNYYINGKVKDGDRKYITEITDFADRTRRTLIGEKAKDLKMETITGARESLYDIDAQYTLVYFFEPSCGHCKHETPKIYKIFEKYKDKGLAGFCVYTQWDKEEWVSYVVKNKLTDWINVWDPTNENNFRIEYSIYSVPQVYLLNKDKTIIGRRLDSTTLPKMLSTLFKNK